MNIIKQRIKTIILRAKYKGENINFTSKSSISINTKLEGRNTIGDNSIIASSSIGFGTYLGHNCTVQNTTIGRYCSIANGFKTIISTHPTENFVSTHPSFYSLKKQAGFTYATKQKYEEIKYINTKEKVSIVIGNDVWIGEDVKIMGGVKIGNGAIIGAGAIVTKDVPPYCINVGIPAKPIKYRFNNKQIEFLEKFEWWNKDDTWLKDNYKLFDDIDLFMEKFNDK